MPNTGWETKELEGKDVVGHICMSVSERGCLMGSWIDDSVVQGHVQARDTKLRGICVETPLRHERK